MQLYVVLGVLAVSVVRETLTTSPLMNALYPIEEQQEPYDPSNLERPKRSIPIVDNVLHGLGETIAGVGHGLVGSRINGRWTYGPDYFPGSVYVPGYGSEYIPRYGSGYGTDLIYDPGYGSSYGPNYGIGPGYGPSYVPEYDPAQGSAYNNYNYTGYKVPNNGYSGPGNNNNGPGNQGPDNNFGGGNSDNDDIEGSGSACSFTYRSGDPNVC